jgi:DNA-binding MarR family transcriptional regulator/GNAT superfamily N-acetyltransferase
MSEAAIEQVRRFNRLVTQRVGALDDRFLSRERSLGEARLLWEIGPDGCDVRRLRSRLGLDSGYLSRLLRSLEASGMATVEPSEADRRVRTARLTPAGLAERDVLDRRNDDLARSMLEPLDAQRQQRLVEAMAEVERLLTGQLVGFEVCDPSHPDARWCLGRYFAELDRRFETGFAQVAPRAAAAALVDYKPPAGVFLVVTLRGDPVGCGALHFVDPETAEIKRMWLAESVRGLGLGRSLLGELERRAVEASARVVRLETNRSLTEAIGLYRSVGYVEVEPFNDLPYAHHWFEKRLDG